MRPAIAFVALSLFALLAGACGVAFSSGSRNNTLFQSLHVTGTAAPGAPLTAALAYQQYLPVPIDITCDLMQNSKKVKAIGTETVPDVPGGSPKATPVSGDFSFDFTVDNPGTYAVKCYTTNDDDNAIAREFTVRGTAAATATTTP